MFSARVIETAAAVRFDVLLRRQKPRGLWRRRALVYDGLWLLVGALQGLVAAAVYQPWIDIVPVVYSVRSLGAGAVVYVAVRRKTPRA